MAARMRTSTLIVRLPPTRSSSRSCSTRSSLACVSSGMSPISSSSSVPPSAISNLPSRALTAPVKAPRSWPNSSLSTSSREKAAQLTLISGRAAARAVVVQRVGDQLLAGAARAADQHREVGRRHLADHVEHALHGGALADQVLEAIRVRRLLLKQPQIAAQRHALEHALDHQLELVVVERLRHVVGGAELHRLDGDLLRAVGGDHDDRGVGRVLLDPAQQVHAGHLPEVEVGDDDVRRACRAAARSPLRPTARRRTS